MPEHEIAFRIDSMPVLIGTVALLLWLTSERFLQFLGLHQPEAPRREVLSSFWHTFSFHGSISYSLLDATMLHWTTIGSSVSGVRYVGVPLVLAGFVVRVVSRLTLGRQFSGHVQTTPGHRFVTTGIYGSIRHPAYLGCLCLFLGFPVCFGSIGGLACALVAGVPGLLYRTRIEEAALEEWFPEEYPRYRAATHRLIPRLW